MRVIPNASRAGVIGWQDDGCLKVKVQAPPEGGRANREVCLLIARALQLPKRSVTVLAGEKNRIKVIGIGDLGVHTIKARLDAGCNHRIISG